MFPNLPCTSMTTGDGVEAPARAASEAAPYPHHSNSIVHGDINCDLNSPDSLTTSHRNDCPESRGTARTDPTTPSTSRKTQRRHGTCLNTSPNPNNNHIQRYMPCHYAHTRARHEG